MHTQRTHERNQSLLCRSHTRSMTFTGELEQRSMHGACPVIKGTKWSMAKWIHAKHFVMNDALDRQLAEQERLENAPQFIDPSTEEV